MTSGAAHRHPRRHARSDSRRAPRTRPWPRATRSRSTASSSCRRACRRTARSSRRPRASIASRWRRSRSTASPGLDGQRRRAGAHRAVATPPTRSTRFTRAASPRRRFSSSPAPTRSRKLTRGTAIRSARPGELRGGLAAGLRRPTRCRERLPALAERMRDGAGGSRGRRRRRHPRSSARGCADAATSRRPRSGGGCDRASRSPGWCRRPSNSTSRNIGCTRATNVDAH